jgi:hypothetical protein
LAEYVNLKVWLVAVGPLSVTATGVTTVIFTTADVADKPPAVATALRPYAFARGKLPATLKGGTVEWPSEVVPAKYSTFVTVPPLTVAFAVRLTLAGAAKVAPAIGLVMLTVGAVASGVERV